jgi:hypothetical protein
MALVRIQDDHDIFRRAKKASAFHEQASQGTISPQESKTKDDARQCAGSRKP